jgi:peptidoglycan/LPS O-acetylase OafA/YrhL
MGLGAVAYGTYLFHPVILVLCYGLIRGNEPRLAGFWDAGVGLVALFLTLAIARVSWNYFEKPLVRRGHKYSYEKERRSPRAGVNALANESDITGEPPLISNT